MQNIDTLSDSEMRDFHNEYNLSIFKVIDESLMQKLINLKLVREKYSQGRYYYPCTREGRVLLNKLKKIYK